MRGPLYHDLSWLPLFALPIYHADRIVECDHYHIPCKSRETADAWMHKWRCSHGRVRLCALMSNQGSRRQSVSAAYLRIRKARPEDHAAILRLVAALELNYPTMELSCFWLAESDGVLIAVAELKDFETCSLLSCVGVRKELQGRGIGRALIDRVVHEALFPVYLYSMIPGFFRKSGFLNANSLPPDLPPRSIYGCSSCDPSLCLCLMRPRDNT